MVMYCEVWENAGQAFESAGLHLFFADLGACKLGKAFGMWYTIYKLKT